MPEFDAKHFLEHCARKPGVYRMFDAEDTILYVGKARNLQARLSSYFQKNISSPKTRALVGRIASVTPSTARVKLLTAPGNEIGVWLPRSRRHGLLAGRGSSRLSLRFIDKDPDVRPGDLVATSPASTLLPPNVPVGVIQSVQERAVPAPTALVQLIAAPEAIDWVQVRIR